MTTDPGATNAALFHQIGDRSFRDKALDVFGDGASFVVSDRPAFCENRAAHRLSLADVALDVSPLDDTAIAERFEAALTRTDAARSIVIVDMAWAQAHVVGTQSIETWSRVAEWLSTRSGVRVVSVYARERLIELHMLAAFQAHSQFVAPSGIYDNPHWLPAHLARTATQDEQLAFLLGRVVPDYAGARFFGQDDRMFARGTSPDWLGQPGRVNASRGPGEAWHIYCFGQLRVYLGGRERVDWRAPGSSPRKTKMLFAYLLQSGERGAEAVELGELLWPGDDPEDQKRARLHHTVAMLRKALCDKGAVVRTGDYYRLNVPTGSWIDISSFEQLCRRGLSLAKACRSDAALEQYRAAEKLYCGDLFADLPADYLHDADEDWILPKRTWLREMAIKLHLYTSILLRSDGRLREAQDHCSKALALDPVNEDANCETLRVLHAQGRFDAMSRQFRQYQSAMNALGERVDYQEVQALYRALSSAIPLPEETALLGPKKNQR